jgi:hypothetical protein
MPETDDRLAQYVEHLEASARARLHRSTPDDKERGLATLPPGISALCSQQPRECLDLIVRALAEPLSPEAVAAVGEGLLQVLLNESAGRLADDVSVELRRNRRFRQAFGFGNYSSVDPAVIEDWVRVFESLGTTKERERKSTWRRDRE